MIGKNSFLVGVTRSRTSRISGDSDLKPSNLFLVGGDIDHVKLLDFGIARRVADAQALTRTGVIIGTLEYMAPEQARGIRDLTQATDFFSLGCILYECLAGQPPFVADHVAAVLAQILLDEPIPITERRLGVPPALSVLLGRLLTKDPQQRLADAATLRATLAELGTLADAGVPATVVSTQPRAHYLGGQEQNLFSIVLAAPPAEPSDPATAPDQAEKWGTAVSPYDQVCVFLNRLEDLVTQSLQIPRCQRGSARP